MSIIDKIIAAVTPPESEEKRQVAHQKARSYAQRVPWLSQVLDHHEQIDAAFLALKQSTDATGRKQALRKLTELLTGHAIAEEGVIYPSLSDNGETGHATMAYNEQSAAKMQLGLLDHMDPMSEDFEDKLGHLEGAVKHHVYQEESNWFIDLVENAPNADHVKISERYAEEFDRYMSGNKNDKGTFDGAASNETHQSDAMFSADKQISDDETAQNAEHDDTKIPAFPPGSIPSADWPDT